MNTPANPTGGPDEELDAILAVPRAKKHLPKWAVVLLILLPLLLAGGITLGVHMHQEQQHQEMVAFVKENRQLIDDYFPRAKVTIDYDSLMQNPMGGIIVKGYLNGDKKLSFGTDFYYSSSGEVAIGGMTYAPEVEPYDD